MPSLHRNSINEKGHVTGMGQTQKYTMGKPFESYLLKMGRIREELGRTVEEYSPTLAATIARFARKLEDILAAIFPIAVLKW